MFARRDILWAEIHTLKTKLSEPTKTHGNDFMKKKDTWCPKAGKNNNNQT